MNYKLTACGLALCGTLTVFATAPAQSQSPTPLMPDLICLERGLENNFVQRLRNGRKILRFGTEIANVGQGAMEIRGNRTSQRQTMEAVQWIYQTDRTRKPTPMGEFIFHGAHGHWHLLEVAEYSLLNSQGTEVVEGRKISFCLMDTKPAFPDMPGAPRRRVYPYCTESRRALRLLSGISVGWEDNYHNRLPDQFVDITGLPAGNYTLRVQLNPRQTILEKDFTNNTASVQVTLE